MRRITTLLVTGGAGFIGSNFARHYLGTHQDARVVNLDKLTYAGNLENLTDVEGDPRYEFVRGDIADVRTVNEIIGRADPDAIVNFAAESHVDRSIMGASPFIETNVCGTLALLECARESWVGRSDGRLFVQISTDEVYGELGATGSFTEQSPLAPTNPYSASKAAADLLCGAYAKTHGLPIIITRCTNNYGPYQFPEKLIPLMIQRASREEKLPVYGDGTNVRDWIHVLDHCRAIEAVLARGESGQIYNIGAGCEKANLDVVRFILAALGRPETLIEFVEDRPGHDARYALDTSKIVSDLGWLPSIPFGEGMKETIRWYLDNGDWVHRCLSGEYREYYAANYGWRKRSSR